LAAMNKVISHLAENITSHLAEMKVETSHLAVR
jgi:hypothetical protein